MKTQCVSAAQFTGGLKISGNVSNDVKTALKASPAAKRFGLFYNANVSQMKLESQSKKGTVYSGLLFDNIRPRNILVGMFDFITRRKIYEGFYFKSGKQNETGLIEVLGNLKKNTFLKMVKR